MMRSRAIVPVVALALAAAAAGCGGGGGDTGGGGTTSSVTTTASSMTKQEFAAKITDICTKGKRKLVNTGFALGSAGSAANTGQAAAEVESDMVEKFRDVQPPEEIKPQVDDFISKAETARDKLKELVHAAINFQGDIVAEVTPEVVAANQEVHAAAKAFGASCFS